VLAQVDSSILQAVARASKRSSGLVREEMRQGVYSLAIIASIAPWFGLFGTILGIVNSFSGIMVGEKTALMAALAKRLSESLWPMGLGLLVGLISLWSYEFLAARLRTFDQEMETASLELLNQISRFRGRFEAAPAVDQPSDCRMFGERSSAELSQEDKTLRHSMILAGAAVVLAWLALAARYFGRYALPLDLAIQSACFYIPITFGISCFPAYPVWIKLLHRRPGGLAALGSAICLAWALAELVLGTSLP